MVTRLFYCAVLVTAIIACTDRVFTYRDTFRLPPDHTDTERRAVTGDNDAARRLGLFYYFIEHDNATALRWFKLAAGRGDEVAKDWVRMLRKQHHEP